MARTFWTRTSEGTLRAEDCRAPGSAADGLEFFLGCPKASSPSLGGMNDYEHIYQKLRKDFGKYCNFEDTDPKMLGTIEMNTEYYEQYVTKNPVPLLFI